MTTCEGSLERQQRKIQQESLDRTSADVNKETPTQRPRLHCGSVSVTWCIFGLQCNCLLTGVHCLQACVSGNSASYSRDCWRVTHAVRWSLSATAASITADAHSSALSAGSLERQQRKLQQGPLERTSAGDNKETPTQSGPLSMLQYMVPVWAKEQHDATAAGWHAETAAALMELLLLGKEGLSLCSFCVAAPLSMLQYMAPIWAKAQHEVTAAGWHVETAAALMELLLLGKTGLR